MIQVNHRTYALPVRPVVGICLDGSDPAYLESTADMMPNLARIVSQGASGYATAVIPSFTNPNNVAMVTGVPPAMNGICGNYYYDRLKNEEVMMTDPSFLTCPTILSVFASAGLNVAAICTKDKLRRVLGHELKGICFSVEKALEATIEENGIDNLTMLLDKPVPSIYDPQASIWCLAVGVQLLKKFKLDLLYLSTTDFIQHKYHPKTAEAKDFYVEVDRILGDFCQLDIVLVLTADHGMNDKLKPDGTPKILFLESELTKVGFPEVKVSLPITDPYVVHHAALGSYATVYLDGDEIDTVSGFIRSLPGIELVLPRQAAAARFALPPEKIGDLVVLSDRDTVIGRTPEWHDLSVLRTSLRSHGGLHETTVPFIVNRPLKREFAVRLATGQTWNYDLFDFACNGVAL